MSSSPRFRRRTEIPTPSSSSSFSSSSYRTPTYNPTPHRATYEPRTDVRTSYDHNNNNSTRSSNHTSFSSLSPRATSSDLTCPKTQIYKSPDSLTYRNSPVRYSSTAKCEYNNNSSNSYRSKHSGSSGSSSAGSRSSSGTGRIINGGGNVRKSSEQCRSGSPTVSGRYGFQSTRTRLMSDPDNSDQSSRTTPYRPISSRSSPKIPRRSLHSPDISRKSINNGNTNNYPVRPKSVAGHVRSNNLRSPVLESARRSVIARPASAGSGRVDEDVFEPYSILRHDDIANVDDDVNRKARSFSSHSDKSSVSSSGREEDQQAVGCLLEDRDNTLTRPSNNDDDKTLTRATIDDNKSLLRLLQAEEDGDNKAVTKPDKSPLPDRRSPCLNKSSEVEQEITSLDEGDKSMNPLVYRPRPRSIATDIGYNKHYPDPVLPLSPEYEANSYNNMRSSTSNLTAHGNNQGGLRSGDRGEVRKWGSCSTLEYNSQQPSTYGQFSERTEGDGGPASSTASSYPDSVNYNSYRRHSGASSDDVILAQKAELDEKNRIIESLKLRVSESDTRQPERAYSDKSGEHGAIAESLDSGIDIRSDSGLMKPVFHRAPDPGYPGSQPPSSRSSAAAADDRSEIARLRLYVKQLETRVDGGGVTSGGSADVAMQKLEGLLQENQKLIDEKNSINRKFTRLQDYLTTLPTVNEFNELKERLTLLTDENKSHQEEQKRTGENTKDSKQKDLELKKYQKRCSDLRENIQKLEKQNNLLKSQNASQSKQELQKVELDKSKMEKQMETLKKEIAVLSEQKESSKNLVGGYYEKYSNELEVNKELARTLEDKLKEVEDVKLQLEDAVEQAENLQNKVSELETERGSLTSQLRDFTDKEECDVSDNGLLMTELHLAFRDLQSIVEVCQMRATGQQLDLSLLLGLGNSPGPVSSSDLTIEDQLKNVQTVRTNIEYLRNQISEIYAEEVGSNCRTQ